MRTSILVGLGAALVATALTAGCSKKEEAPPAPAVEIPKDGVTAVPAAAERDADMVAAEMPMAGAIKEIKAKTLDKDSDDKAKGLLRIKVLALDGPVDISGDTKWEIWKPGSDPEEQKPEMNSWASDEQAVPGGTWDVRFLYDQGSVCKATGWIRNVKIVPGKLWKAEVVMAAPMQFVRIYGTLDGKDLGSDMRVTVYPPGADQEEFKPVTAFWSTEKQAMAQGSYDLRLTYEKDNVKAKADIKGFAVGGNHGVLKKTFAVAK